MMEKSLALTSGEIPWRNWRTTSKESGERVYWDERVCEDASLDMKVFDGDVIGQVNKALNFVLEHTLLSAWLVPGKVEREERNEYPSDAIREAIVNAICHRDYESTGNVQVRIFDDRIDLNDLRNKTIIERKGSGPQTYYTLFSIKHTDRTVSDSIGQ